MDDDGWPATRKAPADDADVLTYLRLHPSTPSPDANSSGDPAEGEVHVALLGGAGEPRTLCDRPAGPDLIEVVADLGDKPCLRCVARAAELACLTGSSCR
ncbi:hypothetical protein [Amycolatopsis sp. NPDC004378]